MIFSSKYTYTGKRLAMLAEMRLQRELGHGDKTMMIASPDDPYHYEPELLWYEIDGELKRETVFYKRRDHPIKTINEWCEYYNL